MGLRYGWWPYVQSMIRKYPERDKAVENKEELERVPMWEYKAVARAIAVTEAKEDGKERMQLVRLVYWKNRRIQSAALDSYISYATARRWCNEFIRTVAEQFGVYDPPEE